MIPAIREKTMAEKSETLEHMVNSIQAGKASTYLGDEERNLTGIILNK
jgi:hypothetical protein